MRELMMTESNFLGV